MKRVRELSSIEARILGTLLEKELATPEYYPMTLKALVAAANQKSNRDPVTRYSQDEVEAALDSLRQDVLVWRGSGARVERWSHALGRRLGLNPASQAVLALLMLRGPQTLGELRSRSHRLNNFDGLEEVRDTLRALSRGEDPLVVELRRAPGQKETRWSHLFAAEGSQGLDTRSDAVAAVAPSAPADALESRVAELERRLATLTERITRLEE